MSEEIGVIKKKKKGALEGGSAAAVRGSQGQLYKAQASLRSGVLSGDCVIHMEGLGALEREGAFSLNVLKRV